MCTHSESYWLDKVEKSIVSIHNVVKYVRSSTTRLQAFKIRVEQEKILGPNGQISRESVILNCSTWWNSTYIMVREGWDLQEVMIGKMLSE